MLSLTSNYLVLSKVIFVFRLFGSSFLKVKNLCFVVKRFIFGESSLPITEARNHESETIAFTSQSESLLSLVPGLAEDQTSLLQTLHEYGLQSNFPTGCILMTTRTECRSCFKPLVVDSKSHVVVVYDLQVGPLVGSRVTKICRKCKIYEHYGFWTLEGKKHYEPQSIENAFLLSSEETAFDINLLKEYSSLLVVGAVPFSTYASSYNRRFGRRGMRKDNTEDEQLQEKSKKKRNIQELFNTRKRLDRRRLEEGFLIFATIEVMERHKIALPYFPFDKNILAEMITEPFHLSFIKTWGEHSCSARGCQNVIVLDGNMKNARQVCSCKSVTQLHFDGMDGAITVGCMNTPSKGSRFCTTHVQTATSFRDDANLMDGVNTSTTPDGNDDDALPIKVINNKITRSGKFYEILWSNGSKTWLKDIHLPLKVKESVENGQPYEQVDITVSVMGQTRKEFLIAQTPNKKPGNTSKYTFQSHGFAKEEEEDNFLKDDGHDGVQTKRLLTCGTEKGKHKCKNAKTAGILVFERPCGVVIDVRELFGSESKSQVYGHLHTLLHNNHMEKTDIICYDDACHLKKFSQNPIRSNNTQTAKRLGEMEILCDKFHFKNHIDRWCKRNCNPYNSDGLKEVNTEVCEQLFSWLSSFAPITKHMNRWRFLFLMLYVLDSHNYDVTSDQ